MVSNEEITRELKFKRPRILGILRAMNLKFGILVKMAYCIFTFFEIVQLLFDILVFVHSPN